MYAIRSYYEIDPLGGVQVTAPTPEQLSVAVGVKFTTASHRPGSVVARTFGAAITGASVSMTVTMNVHWGPASVEHTTGVEPTGKKDPEGGVLLTRPQPALVTGANETTVPQAPVVLSAIV